MRKPFNFFHYLCFCNIIRNFKGPQGPFGEKGALGAKGEKGNSAPLLNLTTVSI